MSKKISYTVKRTFNFLPLVFLLSLIQFQPASALEIQLEDKSSLELFGIGIHQEKRVDIYIGGLFAPTQTSDVNQLTDLNLNKRMSLKFVSKYSNRKMARFWKQRIAMNNSRDSWRPFTKEIIAFADIFKSPIQPGDEINIDYIVNRGTLVYLNGTHFLTIEKKEFFELLLNIWIGAIPPTELFKKGITGKNTPSDNATLISQYEKIQPILGRFDSDKTSLVETSTRVASATPKPKTDTTKSKATSQKPVAKQSTKKTQDKDNSNKAAIETKKLVESLKVDLPITRTQIDKPVVNRPSQKQSSQSDSKLIGDLEQTEELKPNTQKQNKPIQKSDTKPKTTPTKKIAKLDPPEEKLFDADLMVGSYTLELINHIRKYQSYPKKALREGLEGSLTILIKIDADGEIIDSSFNQRSGERILDRAVMKMIRKAQPFPTIPEELSQKEFEFEVPMNFSLTD